MKLKALLLLTTLAAFSPGLLAQDDFDDEDETEEAGDDYARNSFTFGLGAAMAQNQDIPSTCYYSYYYSYCTTSVEPKTGAAVDLRYGFKFNRNWEMTVGTSAFVHDIAYNNYYGYYSPSNDQNTISTLQFGGKYHWYPAQTSKFNIYAGAEVGYGWADVYGYKDSGIAYSLSTGAEYLFTRHFGLRLDARRLWLNTDEVYYYDVNFSRHSLGKPGEMTFGLGVVIPW